MPTHFCAYCIFNQMRPFFIPYILFRFCYGRNLVTDTMVGTIFLVNRFKNRQATTTIFFEKIKQQD